MCMIKISDLVYAIILVILKLQSASIPQPSVGTTIYAVVDPYTLMLAAMLCYVLFYSCSIVTDDNCLSIAAVKQ
jgi:hypothetical protein